MTGKNGLNRELLCNLLDISPNKIHVYESVESTNTLMKEYAENGSGEWEIIISASQHGGRGRMGRQFFSPDDSGLYLSVLLKPSFSPKYANFITTCAAVCACEAIYEVCGVNPCIKWVNDVYIDGKKVAGILTEGGVDPETQNFKYAILGIGINVYKPIGGFPRDIENIAGSVFNGYRGDVRDEYAREKLAAQFVNGFKRRYPKFFENDSLYNDYSSRMFLVGREVDVISHCGSEVRSAVVLGVEKDFSLKVRFADMTEARIFDGEVSLKVKM